MQTGSATVRRGSARCREVFLAAQLDLLGVALLTFVAGLALGRVWTLPIHVDWVLADAGYALNAAQWLLDGALPWRDYDHFWGPYAPLVHVVALATLGARESAVRAACALALATTAAGTYAYGRRALGRRAAAAAALLAWALMVRFLNIGYANLYCVPLAVWGLCLLGGRLSPLRVVGAGLLGGVALAVKINLGGAVVATLWLALFDPQPSRPVAARHLWLDPLWPCIVCFPLAVAALTRGADSLVGQLCFPAAAVLGVLPVVRGAVDGPRDAISPGTLSARWRWGLWFLVGAVLAQTGWVVYYAPEVSFSRIFDGLVLEPMRWGTELLPLPLATPVPVTLAVLAAFCAAAVPRGRRSWRLASALALACATAFYLAPLAVPVAASRWLVWENLAEAMPWFVLVALVMLGWPHGSDRDDAGPWFRHLAVALGFQLIVGFPLADMGHLAFLSPYVALGLAWLVVRGWARDPQVRAGSHWMVCVRALVPLALLLVEGEQRTRPWRMASALTGGGWPEAMQVAPPRADIWAPRLYAEPIRTIAETLRDHPAVQTDRLLSYPVSYFHWLTRTRSVLYHDYVWPGRLEASGDAAEAARLAATPPWLVVFRADPPNAIFNRQLLSETLPRVETFLHTNYVVWRTIPPYRLLVRRDLDPARVPAAK